MWFFAYLCLAEVALLWIFLFYFPGLGDSGRTWRSNGPVRVASCQLAARDCILVFVGTSLHAVCRDWMHICAGL